jgi:excisionase family DNA binding protein
MTTLLTIKQAAEYLTISVSTLKRLLAVGAVTSVRIGRSVRFTHEDLDNYINQSKRMRSA